MQIKFLAQTMDLYQGFDGAQFIVFTVPGVYEVSEEKGTQLLRDFPADFEQVPDQETSKKKKK